MDYLVVSHTQFHSNEDSEFFFGNIGEVLEHGVRTWGTVENEYVSI